MRQQSVPMHSVDSSGPFDTKIIVIRREMRARPRTQDCAKRFHAGNFNGIV